MSADGASPGGLPVQRSLGPILLAPGVAPSQVLIYAVVISLMNCMLGFANLMQPYLFSEMLKAPLSEHGRIAGAVTTAQHVGVLVFIGMAGVLADRIGRRALVIMAIVGYATYLIFAPLATTAIALVMLRFFWGAASTGGAAGGATMMVDYPDNKSRGKFVSLMMLSQYIVMAFIVGGVGNRVPSWLISTGMDPVAAGRMVYWGVAAFGALGAVIAVTLLKSPPVIVDPNKKASPQKPFGLGALLTDLKAVWAESRRNPRFGVVMLVGFVTRSDLYVFQAFLVVWVVAAAGAQGVSAAEAVKTGGLLMATFQIILGAGPLLFGFLYDRFNRTAVMLVSIFFTGAALASTAFVTDVLGPGIFVVVALIGLGESAITVGGQAVFGEATPAHMRGAAMGVFTFAGTLSIVIISILGGILFDSWGYSAPFLLIAGLNIGFVLLAAPILWRQHRRANLIA